MKTILVTGSAQGLGANIIEKFAKNGPVWGQNFKPETIWEGMDKLYQAR